MEMQKYDLAIAYRIYPGMSSGSLHAFGDKRSTAEVCLRSLQRSLASLKAKLWVILDNCPREYEDLVSTVLTMHPFEFVRCAGIGNARTFALQREILAGQSDSEYVLFAEDDYLYRAGQMRQVVGFLSEYPDVDFVTPYDHPDAYLLPVSKSRARLRLYGGVHWRTVSSTCLTFATRRALLLQVGPLFATFNDRNYDASIWHALTKDGIREWMTHPFLVTRDSQSKKVIVKTFLYGWRQVVFGRRYTLWSPIPSIATHLQEGGLAPNVNWLGEGVPENRSEPR